MPFEKIRSNSLNEEADAARERVKLRRAERLALEFVENLLQESEYGKESCATELTA